MFERGGVPVPVPSLLREQKRQYDYIVYKLSVGAGGVYYLFVFMDFWDLNRRGTVRLSTSFAQKGEENDGGPPVGALYLDSRR